MKKILALLSTLWLWPLAVLAQNKLENPLGPTDLRVAVGNIIQAILGLVGVVALAMFIWGGFQMMTSGGEPQKIKTGKDTLIWAAAGIVVIFTAYTLVRTLITALSGVS